MSSRASLIGLMIGGATLGIAVLAAWLFATRHSAPSGAANSEPRQSVATENDSPEFVRLNVNLLTLAFSGAGSAGDQMYKGKLLQVTGRVDQINKKSTGETSIRFVEGQGRLVVQCFLAQDHEQEAAKIIPHKWATIRGRCEGKQGSTILLRDCAVH